MFSSRLKTTAGLLIRGNSTFANFVKNVEAGSLPSLQETRSALSNRTFNPQELETLRNLVKSELPEEFLNEILRHGLLQDFSLYYVASKLADHKWSDNALTSLIEINPGRAFSLEQLINKHSKGSTSTKLSKLLIRKLLMGENSDQGEEKYKPTKNKINKAIDLINKLGNGAKLEDTFGHLYEALLALDAFELLLTLQVTGFGRWLSENKLRNMAEEITEAQFLQVSQFVFNENPLLLSKEHYCVILALDGIFSQYQIFLDEVLQYVERNQLDYYKKDANSLLVRLQLIETWGIVRNDVAKMLEKFHAYQSREKFGIEYVQTRVVKAFCYQSFQNNNATQLKIAETLALPDAMPVSTVAELILAKSQFSTEKSLEVFNKYIQLVADSLNEATRRSPKGVLTEALITSCLYNNDRELAELVLQKAILSRTISDEHDIAALKKAFKAYGDSFVEDSWEVARPIFKSYVLRSIKNQGKFGVAPKFE